MTLGQGRFRRDILGQFTALAPEVWGGKWRADTDCRRLHRVAGQWATPMGRLKGIDTRPAGCAGQTARDQTGWYGRNMAPDYG